jgi:hypothetical protein
VEEPTLLQNVFFLFIQTVCIKVDGIYDNNKINDITCGNHSEKMMEYINMKRKGIPRWPNHQLGVPQKFQSL